MKEMGKKFFATLMVALVAMFVSYNMYQSQNRVSLSDLALANVEALANDESDKVTCCPDPGDSCTLSSGDVLKDQDEC